jgi:hypothetical protein
MTTFTTEDRVKATDPIKPPKPGSFWSGSDSEKFRVIENVYTDDHLWVYYIRISDNKEFSCYVESFFQRFRELPE